ncbi:hypothetical protein FE257_004016 [Aspergillus nanangensis]|uniref:AMP-dependent synthetase/ligase domain-containing protein n=1 Tax=Aspergillus nanangensis TaxID=2582783 RepID=A0AAD4CRT7_ASPNN|nr:hypothetical protein FE257_004016 [Aspergillus nanangensis]
MVPKQTVWVPSDIESTNIVKFIKHVNHKHGLQLQTYDELWQWSVHPDTLAVFWREAWTFLGIGQTPGNEADVLQVLDDDGSASQPSMFPPPKFFPSETFNLAQFILSNRDPGQIAINFVREGVPGVKRIPWAVLQERTREAYDAMVSSGVKAGDKVAVVMSNSVNAIILCLATLAIGAVWSSASPDLGSKTIIDCYAQIEPKILFTDDAYRYAGKTILLEERIAAISRALNGQGLQLNHVVIVPYCGGVTLKINTDTRLQHDMRPGDIFFQYTTTAWIMCVLNFVNLSSGATMLLYDGSPFYPDPGVLLDLAGKLGVTVFGTSPRYLSELRSRNIVPHLYEWFYRHGFPQKTQLISMSGGTDIAGSFVGGCPILPIYPGEIQAKCLGMAVDVFDASKTEPVSIEQSGEPGELVCTQPFPSQPLAFYGSDGKRNIDRRTSRGSEIIDGVLNPSGVRFGSAEIYQVVDTISEIADSICVGQRRAFDSDETVLLFVKIMEPHRLDAALIASIKSAIKVRCSPRHVPAYVLEVPDIPYTVNGKKCEINVKQIVSGMNTKVSGTVANPESLKAYQQYFNLPRTAVPRL